MNLRPLQAACLMVAIFLLCPTLTSGEGLEPVPLLEPQMDTGRPLMQVLKDRGSSRAFNTEKLPKQVLSNLLWAAFGVNRLDGRKAYRAKCDELAGNRHLRRQCRWPLPL